MPKILLLEDDFLIAFDMKTQLEDAGMEVVGPVASNEDAKALIEPGQSMRLCSIWISEGLPRFLRRIA